MTDQQQQQQQHHQHTQHLPFGMLGQQKDARTQTPQKNTLLRSPRRRRQSMPVLEAIELPSLSGVVMRRKQQLFDKCHSQLANLALNDITSAPATHTEPSLQLTVTTSQDQLDPAGASSAPSSCSLNTSSQLLVTSGSICRCRHMARGPSSSPVLQLQSAISNTTTQALTPPRLQQHQQHLDTTTTQPQRRADSTPALLVATSPPERTPDGSDPAAPATSSATSSTLVADSKNKAATLDNSSLCPSRYSTSTAGPQLQQLGTKLQHLPDCVYARFSVASNASNNSSTSNGPAAVGAPRRGSAKLQPSPSSASSHSNTSSLFRDDGFEDDLTSTASERMSTTTTNSSGAQSTSTSGCPTNNSSCTTSASSTTSSSFVNNHRLSFTGSRQGSLGLHQRVRRGPRSNRSGFVDDDEYQSCEEELDNSQTTASTTSNLDDCALSTTSSSIIHFEPHILDKVTLANAKQQYRKSLLIEHRQQQENFHNQQHQQQQHLSSTQSKIRSLLTSSPSFSQSHLHHLHHPTDSANTSTSTITSSSSTSTTCTSHQSLKPIKCDDRTVNIIRHMPTKSPGYWDSNLSITQRVVTEIIETERAYVDDLEQIVTGYICYLRNQLKRQKQHLQQQHQQHQQQSQNTNDVNVKHKQRIDQQQQQIYGRTHHRHHQHNYHQLQQQKHENHDNLQHQQHEQHKQQEHLSFPTPAAGIAVGGANVGCDKDDVDDVDDDDESIAIINRIAAACDDDDDDDKSIVVFDDDIISATNETEDYDVDETDNDLAQTKENMILNDITSGVAGGVNDKIHCNSNNLPSHAHHHHVLHTHKHQNTSIKTQTNCQDKQTTTSTTTTTTTTTTAIRNSLFDGTVLTASDIKKLFSNLEDIYKFNKDLLFRLEECYLNPSSVAECFVENASGFEVYTHYCTMYPQVVATLTELMANPNSARMLKERQNELNQSLPLGAYLLKPVQRILKYHILFQSLINHTATDESINEKDRQLIDEALSVMTNIACHINSMKKRHEHAIRVQEVQGLLSGWPQAPDLTTLGELILEESFKMFNRPKSCRHLFLFDSVLLITKKKRDGTLCYKGHIACSNLMLIENIEGQSLVFNTVPFDNPKALCAFQAKNLEKKREWCIQIKEVIIKSFDVKIPVHVRDIVMSLTNAGTKAAADNNNQHTSPKSETTRALRAPNYLERKRTKQDKKKLTASAATSHLT